MAGADQSANLGGMLSQIGGTFAGMGKEQGQMFSDMIANANRPQANPNDPDSYRRLAEWARSNGKADEARMYDNQYAQAQTEQRRVRKEAIDQATAGMVNDYAKAVRSGENVQKAYDTLMEYGKNAGVDVTSNINNIESAERARENAEIQRQEQERRKQEREAVEQAQTAFNEATKAEDFEAAVDAAPPAFRDAVRLAANREMQFRQSTQQMAAQAADMAAVVDLAPVQDMVDAVQNDGVKGMLNKEMTKLEARRSQLYKNGQWVSPAAKKQYEKEVSAVARKAWDAETQRLSDEAAEQRFADRQYTQAINRARSGKVTETEIENYQAAQDASETTVGDFVPFYSGDKPSREEAIKGVLTQRVAAVEEAFGRGSVEPTGTDEERIQL